MNDTIQYNQRPAQLEFRNKIKRLGFNPNEYARSAVSQAQADFYKKYGVKHGWNLKGEECDYRDEFLYQMMLPQIDKELEQINDFCVLMVDFLDEYDMNMARKWTCGNANTPDYSLSEPDVVKRVLRRMVFDKARNDFLINEMGNEVAA